MRQRQRGTIRLRAKVSIPGYDVKEEFDVVVCADDVILDPQMRRHFKMGRLEVVLPVKKKKKQRTKPSTITQDEE